MSGGNREGSGGEVARVTGGMKSTEEVNHQKQEKGRDVEKRGFGRNYKSSKKF